MTAPIQGLACHFRGQDTGGGTLEIANQKLYLSGTYDGWDYWPLGNQPAYDDNNTIRDPTLYVSNASGTMTFYFAYTHLNSAYANVAFPENFMQGADFGIVKTTDGQNFTHVAYVDTSAAQASTPSVPSWYGSPGTWVTALTSASVSGSVTSIPVQAMKFAIPASSTLTLPSGQQVTTAAAIQPRGATSITLAHSFTISPAMVSGAAMTASSGTYLFGDYVSYSGSTYVCTVGVTSTGFFPPSTDTSHWARRQAIWGPQWFLTPGGDLYVFVQVNIQDIYAFKCLDLVNLNSWDTGTLVIDADVTSGVPDSNYATFVLWDGTHFHLFANSQRLGPSQNLQGMWHATSSSLLSGYSVVNNSVQVPEIQNIEGPYIINDGSQYRLYGDTYGNGGQIAFTASALNGSWSSHALTVRGGLTQFGADPGGFEPMREGAFGGLFGFSGATGPYGSLNNPAALAIVQALPLWPPRIPVGPMG